MAIVVVIIIVIIVVIVIIAAMICAGPHVRNQTALGIPSTELGRC